MSPDPFSSLPVENRLSTELFFSPHHLFWAPQMIWKGDLLPVNKYLQIPLSALFSSALLSPLCPCSHALPVFHLRFHLSLGLSMACVLHVYSSLSLWVCLPVFLCLPAFQPCLNVCLPLFLNSVSCLSLQAVLFCLSTCLSFPLCLNLYNCWSCSSFSPYFCLFFFFCLFVAFSVCVCMCACLPVFSFVCGFPPLSHLLCFTLSLCISCNTIQHTPDKKKIRKSFPF